MSWSFSEIAVVDPNRAKLLEFAPSPDTIVNSIFARFEFALKSEQVRIGMEESSSNPQDLRVVLQFPVGESLSDQFFNANTGYRAQFRHDWKAGLLFNRKIIVGVRTRVETALPPLVCARRLSPDFEDLGEVQLSREQLLASLDPDLSKIWFCGLLIGNDGDVKPLAPGLTGPRLRLDDQTTWAAVERNEDTAWLDVKGAFIGADGPYQPKNPRERAKK